MKGALLMNKDHGEMRVDRALPPLRPLMLAVLLLAPVIARADLYEGRAIVTGTGPASRAEALPQALRWALVKASGDPALAEDPRVDTIGAAGLLQDEVFLDRMTDIPHHDEQGTRERPWDYIAHFDPAGIAAALAQLGHAVWPEPRPRLLARIVVQEQDGHTYPLSNDADDGERQREALLQAAARFGMRVALPPRAVPQADLPGTVPLVGTLRWSEADAGWVGAWHMAWEGRDHDWGIAGVSFDAAFRDAVGGAAALLSARR